MRFSKTRIPSLTLKYLKIEKTPGFAFKKRKNLIR